MMKMGCPKFQDPWVFGRDFETENHNKLKKGDCNFKREIM